MKKITVFILIAALALAFVGCDKIVEKATKKAIEKGTGVSVDDDGNTVKVKGKDGEAEYSGSEGKIPDGFPGKFPKYEDAKVISGSKISTEEGTSYYVNWETGDNLDEVSSFYKKALPGKGYKITAQVESGDSASFNFENGWVALNKQENKTEISVTLSIK